MLLNELQTDDDRFREWCADMLRAHEALLAFTRAAFPNALVPKIRIQVASQTVAQSDADAIDGGRAAEGVLA